MTLLYISKLQKLFMLNVFLFISCFLLLDCKKKEQDQDIEDCDKISNYYKDGTHYIRRDLVTDDGVVNYNKLLDDSKIENSDCYPAKDKDVDASIRIRE
ncbi:hypothetical protein [Leptospira sp. GIMC2001]|uniref:hypothetical protein n=1 Tax=Leptospira sp. GIMC2001 TaxID=1513297 RepID=UPI00234B425D|nr:hypothetical protein [Leptospira sp. GIMC2001]WCL49535.1 hypothetical protein O4O04_01590 [Leptospira sp. GIMC2001]